jgi:TRAP-type C4-dicarboxylate transport system substrate-binding protein
MCCDGELPPCSGIPHGVASAAMRRVALAVAVLAAAVSGCGGAVKVTGARPDAVTTLTLANANEGPGGLQAWVDGVQRLSKGRLRIRVVNNWRLGEPGFEKGLISDVRAGRTQLGWVASRAWTAVGVHSLDPLNVPFEVGSYAGEQAELSAASRAPLLAGVTAAGMEPIGLVPGALHWLLLRRPVARPGDLQGLRIGLFDSAVGARALAALGAVGVPLARSASLHGLDGVALGAGDLAALYVSQARYLLSDAPLGPAPRVIFANRRSWSRLSSEQRAILRHAAELAFAPMLSAAKADGRNAQAELCDANVRLVAVGAAGRAALKREVGPVFDQVSGPRDARAARRAVEQARGVDQPDPITCAAATHTRRDALTGAFEYTVRRGDPGAVRDELEGFRSVRFKVVFRDGRAVQTVAFPDGHSEVGFDERYSVYRDRITFGGDHGAPLKARWRLTGNRLRFTEMNGGPSDDRVWVRHPWTRVRR